MTRAQPPSSFPRRSRGAFFASLVLLCGAAVSSADVPATQLLPGAAFSQTVYGRSPADAFVTDLGVYELDTEVKAIRIWQRSDEGLELFRPQNEVGFRPFTARQIEATSAGQRPQRFLGVPVKMEAGVLVPDPTNAVPFKQPVGLDKHPTADKFAVVSAGEYVNQGNNRYTPSIRVYEFAETAGADGALGSVELALAEEFSNAFYTKTNGANLVLDHIFTYGGGEYCSTNANVGGTTSEWYYGTRRAPLSRTNVTTRVVDGVPGATTNVLWYGPLGTGVLTITNVVANADGTAETNVLHYADVVVRGGGAGNPSAVEFLEPIVVVGDSLVAISPTDVSKNGVLHSFRAYPETTTPVTGADGVRYVLCGYPGTVVQIVTGGSGEGFRTTDLVSYETHLVSRSFTTNWIYVISADPPVTQTNDTSRTGLEEPVWWDSRNTSLFVPDFEYTVIRTNDWIAVSTNYCTLTNWVWTYTTTTNANYLETARDVAFLGDAGLVALIAAEDHQSVRSGFLVFGTDPSGAAKIFPAGDLDRAIRGIAVDKDTGDVYAAVPDLAAVFRYPAPTPGDVSSWTTADATTVFHDGFVAGVPGQPGSDFGLLSNPEDVSVWYPDGGGPVLLVADTANGRIHAFDPNSLTWTATNWLGSTYVQQTDLSDPSTWDPTGWSGPGSPFSTNVAFVVATNTVSVQRFSGGRFTTVWVDVVTTNYYRLGNTAFPLFTVGSSGAVSSDPLNNPRGVAGKDGEPVFAVADTENHRVRLYGVDLAGMESDEILAMAVWWPGSSGAWSGLSIRDLAVTNASAGGSVAWLDAFHTNSFGGPVGLLSGTSLLVQEHETCEYELHFTVAPSRQVRTYSLAVADADGAVVPVRAAVDLPAGETEGVFTLVAKDGRAWTEETVSWRDSAGNAVTNGAPEAAYAVTNSVVVLPVCTLEVSSGGGYSTNATLAVANVDPVITNALFRGVVLAGPSLSVTGLVVRARDWVEADADLRYLWWATTNVNWAANNLDWAVTHTNWAASASAEWSEIDPFEAEQTATASELTGTPVSDVVTNAIDLVVAVGPEVVLPFGYDVWGLDPEYQPGASPFFAVCTVLDKDGGAAIITFPTPHEPTETAARWNLEGGYGGGGGDGGAFESTAVYAARFTAISRDDVTFVVTLVSGTPLPSDTVSLECAASLAGPWTKLGNSFTVGDAFSYFPSAEVTNRVPNAGSVDTRFYRIVQP